MERQRKRPREAAREPSRAREYRCPLCGHVDEAEVQGSEQQTIRCSYCDTLLSVRVPSLDSQRLEVRIDGEERGS